MSPQTIQCGSGARRSREEYLNEIEFVSSNQDVASILSGFNKINEQNWGNTLSTGTIPNSGSYYQHIYSGKPCEMPKKVDGAALLYRYTSFTYFRNVKALNKRFYFSIGMVNLLVKWRTALNLALKSRSIVSKVRQANEQLGKSCVRMEFGMDVHLTAVNSKILRNLTSA